MRKDLQFLCWPLQVYKKDGEGPFVSLLLQVSTEFPEYSCWELMYVAREKKSMKKKVRGI